MDDLYQSDIEDSKNGESEGSGEGAIDGKEPDSSQTPPASTTTSSTLAFGQNFPISIDNKGAYPVQGVCDSSQGDVMVTIGSSEESVSFICENDNSFSGRLNASFVDSDPVTITIVQESGGTEIALLIQLRIRHSTLLQSGVSRRVIMFLRFLLWKVQSFPMILWWTGGMGARSVKFHHLMMGIKHIPISSQEITRLGSEVFVGAFKIQGTITPIPTLTSW